MLQARFNLITADPDRMADTVGYIKSEIRPAVESLHGSMGMSLYANTEVGVAVLESFWASRAALIASEQITAPRRKDRSSVPWAPYASSDTGFPFSNGRRRWIPGRGSG